MFSKQVSELGKEKKFEYFLVHIVKWNIFTIIENIPYNRFLAISSKKVKENKKFQNSGSHGGEIKYHLKLSLDLFLVLTYTLSQF